MNSVTSCVGDVADHRRPRAGSFAGPGRSFFWCCPCSSSEPRLFKIWLYRTQCPAPKLKGVREFGLRFLSAHASVAPDRGRQRPGLCSFAPSGACRLRTTRSSRFANSRISSSKLSRGTRRSNPATASLKNGGDDARSRPILRAFWSHVHRCFRIRGRALSAGQILDRLEYGVHNGVLFSAARAAIGT